MWTSFIINVVSVCITSAILSEICSALPISGSLYNWAAAAAGPVLRPLLLRVMYVVWQVCSCMVGCEIGRAHV